MALPPQYRGSRHPSHAQRVAMPDPAAEARRKLDEGVRFEATGFGANLSYFRTRSSKITQANAGKYPEQQLFDPYDPVVKLLTEYSSRTAVPFSAVEIDALYRITGALEADVAAGKSGAGIVLGDWKKNLHPHAVVLQHEEVKKELQAAVNDYWDQHEQDIRLISANHLLLLGNFLSQVARNFKSMRFDPPEHSLRPHYYTHKNVPEDISDCMAQALRHVHEKYSSKGARVPQDLIDFIQTVSLFQEEIDPLIAEEKGLRAERAKAQSAATGKIP